MKSVPPFYLFVFLLMSFPVPALSAATCDAETAGDLAEFARDMAHCIRVDPMSCHEITKFVAENQEGFEKAGAALGSTGVTGYLSRKLNEVDKILKSMERAVPYAAMNAQSSFRTDILKAWETDKGIDGRLVRNATEITNLEKAQEGFKKLGGSVEAIYHDPETGKATQLTDEIIKDLTSNRSEPRAVKWNIEYDGDKVKRLVLYGFHTGDHMMIHPLGQADNEAAAKRALSYLTGGGLQENINGKTGAQIVAKGTPEEVARLALESFKVEHDGWVKDEGKAVRKRFFYSNLEEMARRLQALDNLKGPLPSLAAVEKNYARLAEKFTMDDLVQARPDWATMSKPYREIMKLAEEGDGTAKYAITFTQGIVSDYIKKVRGMGLSSNARLGALQLNLATHPRFGGAFRTTSRWALLAAAAATAVYGGYEGFQYLRGSSEAQNMVAKLTDKVVDKASCKFKIGSFEGKYICGCSPQRGKLVPTQADYCKIFSNVRPSKTGGRCVPDDKQIHNQTFRAISEAYESSPTGLKLSLEACNDECKELVDLAGATLDNIIKIINRVYAKDATVNCSKEEPHGVFTEANQDKYRVNFNPITLKALEIRPLCNHRTVNYGYIFNSESVSHLTVVRSMGPQSDCATSQRLLSENTTGGGDCQFSIVPKLCRSHFAGGRTPVFEPEMNYTNHYLMSQMINSRVIAKCGGGPEASGEGGKVPFGGAFKKTTQ